MMVNLQVPSDRPKYLKLKISLEVADEKIVDQVEPMHSARASTASRPICARCARPTSKARPRSTG